MKDSAKLKQERAEKRAKLQEIHNAAKEEKRNYTEDEQSQVDTLLGEVRSLDTQIERAEGVEAELARSAAAAAGNGSAKDLSSKEERDLKNFSFLKIARSAATGEKLEGLEKEMQEEARNEMRNSGITPSSNSLQIPTLVLRNAWGSEKRDVTATGGSNGSQGGVTVATSVQGYIEALQNRTLLTTLGAGMMTGLVGNIDMPRENAVFAPSWEGENDDAAESSPTFTKVTFSPKRLSGYIEVSDQLLLQSSSSIEMRLRNQILTGHAVALDKAGWQGTGTNDQPTGILTDGDITVVAIGANGGAITDAKILEMESTIDTQNALDGSLAYAFTPAVRRILKGLKVDDGSGLFVWDRLTNQVNAYPAYSTNQLPTTLVKGSSGAVCHAAVYGDYSAASFGMWGGIEIKVDPYTQAKKALTTLILNAYHDFHVLQPGKLTAIKDITV